MNRILPTWYILFVAVAAPAVASPPQAVAIALADAKTLPPDRARHTKYLDLTYKVSDEERQKAFEWISFHLNQLSKESEIVQPRLVGPHRELVAFDIRDYGIDRMVYGKLLAANDPYFHVQADVTVTDGYGRKYVERRFLAAPWVGPAGIAELYTLTDSQVPILRADWFLYQTGQQKDRVVGYYDILGIGKTENDFLKFVGVDVKLAEEKKKEMRAAVGKSGVTLNNRAIQRLQSITGGFWRTEDFKSSVDKQNTLRLLDGATQPPHGDATEQYGSLANGLFVFFLANDKGERQDAAPDFIAGDKKSSSNDTRVHICISCVRCHVEGLRPINDFARTLFRDRGQLRSLSYDKIKRLRQVYLSDLPGQLDLDVAYYAAAVRKCNGLDVVDNSRLFASAWADYESDLGLEEIAWEVGVGVEVLKQKLAPYIVDDPGAPGGKLFDPVVGGLLQNPPIRMRREHFEETYLIFQRAVGGVP